MGVILERKKRILLNEPHIVTTTPAGIANFSTDLIAPLKSCKVEFSPVQAGTGDPSPSNVRAISGWTGCKITRCGKNLFDINGDTSLIYAGVAIQNNRIVISSIGSGATSRVYFSTLYKPGTYTFSCKFSGDINNIRVFSPKPFTGGTYNSYYGGYFKELSNGSVTITTTEQFTIGVIATGVARGQGAVYDLQFELGSTTTPYEPYTGSTIPIDWTTEAGTVYGGSLDVTTGLLTVDRAEVDLGTLRYSNDPNRPNVKYTGSLTNLIMKQAPWADAVCSEYRLSKVGPDFLTNGQFSTTNAYGSGAIFFKNDAFIGKTNAELQEYLSGVQLVYELATPITYQLTPTQLKSLRGVNNIWSDANGDTTVKYWTH